jgi:Tat protein secretion system quality control protein TatD with DNase activity
LNQRDEEKFEELLSSSKKIVAIGECGLDYHYIEHFFEKDSQEKNISHSKEDEKVRQQKEFKAQIAFAVKHNLPLMLHGRPSKKSMDAYEDMLAILEDEKKKHGTRLRGNAHFFCGINRNRKAIY